MAKAEGPEAASPTGGAGAAANMKGYKTLADGTKTSFFHMEVSEEAKALQAKQGLMQAGGKKIDAPEAAQCEASVVEGAEGPDGAAPLEDRDLPRGVLCFVRFGAWTPIASSWKSRIPRFSPRSVAKKRVSAEASS